MRIPCWPGFSIMKINELDCPTCGAPLSEQVVLDQPFTCPACGSVLVLTDTIQDDRITCPKCRTINESTNRFCSLCGAALNVRCPFCYQANQLGAVHCESCGANLRNAAQRRKDWLTQKRAHDAERLAALKRASSLLITPLLSNSCRF